MKKFLSLVLVIVLCFTLFACVSKPSPTEVVNSYFTALKSNDVEQLSKLYSGDVSEVSFDDALNEIPDSIDEDFLKNLIAKFTSFEFNTSNEVIDGDKATVDVNIKTYNLGDAFKTAISQFFIEGFALAFSNPSDDEMDKLMVDKFEKALNEATFDYESTVTLNLTKTEKGWIIDEYDKDSDIFNALTGGIVDAASEMSDSFGGNETE